tara:strand:+ start:30842 stop:31285 length:444 start_codon:yes stop_codon:yes gene_type:complete
LVEAVHALIRERNYLREVRNVQLAEHESDLAQQRDHTEEIRLELDAVRSDRDLSQERSEFLEGQVAIHHARVVELLHDLAAQRRKAAALLEEIAAHRSSQVAPDPERAFPREDREAHSDRGRPAPVQGAPSLTARVKQRLRLWFQGA